MQELILRLVRGLAILDEDVKYIVQVIVFDPIHVAKCRVDFMRKINFCELQSVDLVPDVDDNLVVVGQGHLGELVNPHLNSLIRLHFRLE